MRFGNEDNFSKITLSESYNNNYKVLFEDCNKNKVGVKSFNSIPIFKYEKLILKYNNLPTQDDIKKDIEEFLGKLSNGKDFKIFSIKGNKIKIDEHKMEYVISVAFVCFI